MRRYLPVVALAAVISTLSAVVASAQVPIITQQPVAVSVSEGRDAIFSIEVLDVGTSVQWQKGYSSSGPFSNVVNGNGTELHLPNVGLSDSGTYYRAAATLTGNTVYSAPASLTVVPAVAPRVQTVDVPASGYYNAGQILNFRVQMDQSVSVTGTPAIQIVIGAASREAAYRSGSGSTVLTFSYTVQAGDMDMDGIGLGTSIALNGGTIASSHGDPAELALNGVPPTSQILINTNSPTVILSTSSPPDLPIRLITVTFSEAVTGLTQGDFGLTLTGSAVGSVTGLRTSDNITYEVLVFYTSGTGTFSLQLPANSAVNAGNNGNLASNTLIWQVGSSINADLRDIRPSSGTLTPNFSASITSYVVNVANDVAQISLTSVLADTTATMTLNGISISDGMPSPAISLAVGNNAVNITVTAQDNATTNTYRVNIIRAQSGNAGLVGLVSTVGSLEPAFSPGTTSYALSVPFDTAALQLMPTAGDPAATITINGNAVASGTMSASLPLGSVNTALTVVVTAQNGTTRTYTVNAARAGSSDTRLAGLVPSIGTLEPAFSPETLSYSVEVEQRAQSIAFRPTLSNASARALIAGHTVTSGSMSEPIDLTVGANTVSIVVTAQNGATRSYTISVNRAKLVFPDPTIDPEVIGLLNAQTSAASRFAQTQIRNFQNRLEQLHDEGERRKSSFGVRLGGPSNWVANHPSDLPEPAPKETGSAALGYAAENKQRFPDGGTGRNEPDPFGQSFDPDLGPFAIWTGGFVNFGERDTGRLDLDYTLVGVSGGIDYRFSERLVAGFGVGYGRDRTDVGDKGTESHATAYSAAFYGSYRPFDNLFVDALVGGSVLNFDSMRFVAADGDLTDGKRNGNQLFASLTAAYEIRRKTWLVSPYGRLEISRSWLDGYSEGGDSTYRLSYGGQTADSAAGVIGVRANYSFDYEWGRLAPGVRAEYAHDFRGSSRARMGYSVLGGFPYALDTNGETSDSANAGLTLDASFNNAWSAGLEYRMGLGGSEARDHAFAIRIGAKF